MSNLMIYSDIFSPLDIESPFGGGPITLALPPAPADCSTGRSHRPRKPRLRPVGRKAVSLVQQHLAEGRPLVAREGNADLAYSRAKRLLDIVGALTLLMLLGPVMLAILIVLLVTTKGRPLFWQRRAGHLGYPFMLCKFRSMRLDADRIKHTVENEQNGPTFKNRRDPRITRIGRFLRKTSLDETPQLFHVLLGQMSLVGPRPLDINEVASFAPWQRRRLAVMPGLTCLWQVSGRSEVAFEDWIRMDLWYLRNQNLWTDCMLLLRTPWSVLGGRGAY